MSSDRRSGGQRRITGRHPVDIGIEWEGWKGREAGSLSDVSMEGCFVLGSGDVRDGDPVKIFVPLADGTTVKFDAHVANHVLEIGFGAKFEPLSPAQRELLDVLMEKQG